MKYKGLFLDFGSVVMKSFFETHRSFERLAGLKPNTLTWYGPFDPKSDPLWQDMLAGRTTEREYWKQRSKECGALIGETWTTVRDFCMYQNKIPLDEMLRDEALRLMADAKASGIKTGILTNELEFFHGREWLDSIPLTHEVDYLYDATHTHILKPDPRAYQMALEGIGLDAHEVIFIDDLMHNVKGGEAVGMCSIHLDILNPNKAFAQARELLALAP